MPQTHSLSPVGRANSEGVLFQRTEYRSRHPSSVEVGESMSWTTGASVDAAASARLFTLGENTTGLSSRGLPMAPDRSEHDVATATRRGIADNPYNSDIEAGARPEDLVVLTPTRIRVDSRVVFAHCTSNWLSNCFWLICILFKVSSEKSASWWIMFSPTWVHHAVSLLSQAMVIIFHKQLVEKHIGPPPPSTSSPAISMQYNILRRVRIKSHIVDGVNTVVDGLASLAAKIMICHQLQTSFWSYRLTFLPFGVAWVLSTGLIFIKDKQERVFGSARDLLYMFLLMVALKLDGIVGVNWRLVFLIPWLWFSAIFLLAVVIGFLLSLARVWARLTELLLPLGFFSLLVSCVPQFVSYYELVSCLESGTCGEDVQTLRTVLVLNAVSWFMMWCSSLMLVTGLRQKERIRETLLAAGHVWTAHENLAHRLASEAAASAQRRVDLMSDDEVSQLVEEMMRGKSKPSMLVRVGESLYRIITREGDGTQVVPTGGGDIEQGRGAGPAGPGSEECAGSAEAEEGGRPLATLPDEVRGGGGGEADLLLPNMVEQSETPGGQDRSCEEKPARGERQLDRVPTGLTDATDDLTCIICCDALPTCVLLSCGHGGFCRRCANIVFVRPPNECPTCRQKIEQVVELEYASRKVGDVLRVK